MASTPTTAAPPDQNSYRPLRPNGKQHLDRSITHASDYPPNFDFRRQELVPPSKGAVTKIDTTGSAHPTPTKGRGRRALASNGTSALRPCKRIDAAPQVTAKANRLNDMIRGSSPLSVTQPDRGISRALSLAPRLLSDNSVIRPHGYALWSR